LRPAGHRVLPGDPGLAAGHADPGFGPRPDPAVRGLRADVHPPLLPGRVPQARAGGGGGGAEVLPGGHGFLGGAGLRPVLHLRSGGYHRRARHRGGHVDGPPDDAARHAAGAGRPRFKIAAFPFHMWVPDTYEAASTRFVAWLSVAPKAAGFVAIFRVYFEGGAERAAAWVPVAPLLATITMLAGNLMALPQQNTKRLLAYSGIAQIGYMLVGVSAASASGTAMVLFYLVAYVFGNMG